MEMVRLGIAFIIAGIVNSGAEMFIRSYLNVAADLEIVGFYNAGYILTVTYASMVFGAMETDYYPRLSAVNSDRQAANETVNRQIEVSILLVSPMLAVLITILPILIPLLYTHQFQPVATMSQVAVLAMYAKAVSLPISYLTLAKSDPIGFVTLDFLYDLILVLLIVVGYQQWGLWGTGLAIAITHFMELAMVYCYARLRFGFRLSAPVIQYASMQIPLGLAIYFVTLSDSAVTYWGLCSILCFVSTAISFTVLRQKTSLWDALIRKIKGKLGKS
jgi:O-antigen/teichoic acid export membrane protein